MGSGFQDRWFLTAWQRCQAAQELHHSYCVNLFYIVSLGLFSPLDAALVCERQTRNVAGAVELFFSRATPLFLAMSHFPKVTARPGGGPVDATPILAWFIIFSLWLAPHPRLPF